MGVMVVRAACRWGVSLPLPGKSLVGVNIPLQSLTFGFPRFYGKLEVANNLAEIELYIDFGVGTFWKLYFHIWLNKRLWYGSLINLP